MACKRSWAGVPRCVWMFPLSAAYIWAYLVEMAPSHASRIRSQALECSELISSGDIICEVACSCGDKQDGSQTTDATRKHSGKFIMVQGEEIVRKQWVPYFSMIINHTSPHFPALAPSNPFRVWLLARSEQCREIFKGGILYLPCKISDDLYGHKRSLVGY